MSELFKQQLNIIFNNDETIVNELINKGYTLLKAVKIQLEKPKENRIPSLKEKNEGTIDGFIANINDLLSTPTTSTVNNSPQQVIIKRWTFGDTILDNSYYHVPFSKLQLNNLFQRVNHPSSRTLVQGAFRSGKTSHLNALREMIKSQFFTIIITLRSENEIWAQISSEIKICCPNSPDINGPVDFKQFFAPVNCEKYFSKKKVVILFDEFQFIESSPFKENLLLPLKDLLNTPKDYVCLYSVVAFGTSKLINISSPPGHVKTLYSPFHYNDIVYINPLPFENVKTLLFQWAQDRNFNLPDNVCEDIYRTVGGYAGLLGIVGIELDNKIARIRDDYRGTVTVSAWLEVRDYAFSRLQDAGMYRYLKQYIIENQSIKTLIHHILSNREPYVFLDGDYQNALTLCTFGVLWMENNSFYLTCPMIKQLLLNQYYRKVPNVHLPHDWSDNIPSLIQSIVPSFNFDAFYAEESQNISTKFPSEYNFQAEFYSIVRQGIMQAAFTPGGPYCVTADLLIRNGHRILFELKSCQKWTSWEIVLPSIKQALLYAQFLNCKKIVVINFTSVSNGFSNISIKMTSMNIMVYVYEVLWNASTNTFQLQLPAPINNIYNTNF